MEPEPPDIYDLSEAKVIFKEISDKIDTIWNELESIKDPDHLLQVQRFSSEYSRSWSIEYCSEDRAEDLIPRELWFEDLDEDPKPVRDFRARSEPLREKLEKFYESAWKCIIDKTHPHIHGSSMPVSPTGNLYASVSIELARALYMCPSCAHPVEDRPGHQDNYNSLVCPGRECNTILIKDFTEDCEMTSGIHLLEYSDSNAVLLRQAMAYAHVDDNRFLRHHPLDEWRDGRMRFWVAVKDGRLIGFSCWNKFDDKPTLRIIWVRKDSRGGGTGTKLLMAEINGNQEWCVESPNAAFRGLIKKLELPLDNVSIVRGA